MRPLTSIAVVAALSAPGCGGGSSLQTSAHTSTSRAVPPRLVHRTQVIGRSVQGRTIRVTESGNPAAPSILVVGCIHGTEQAGVAVTRRLIAARPPAGAHLWIVNFINPDGAAAAARVNARGVDLNRNFPWRWRAIGSRGDLQYSGPHPASEPETRIAMRLVERLRPTATVWFHQPVGIVRAYGHSVPAARRFARVAGLPFRLLRWLSGSASNWQNHRFRRASSFVVEIPPGTLSRAAVARYVRAVRSLTG
jgi:protein MpaA